MAFEEASTIFSDPCYLLRVDPANPDRFLALGLSGLLRLLVVVHVERGPRFRIISARKATATEETQYEKRHY